MVNLETMLAVENVPNISLIEGKYGEIVHLAAPNCTDLCNIRDKIWKIDHVVDDVVSTVSR